jgi:hypothetical protein
MRKDHFISVSSALSYWFFFLLVAQFWRSQFAGERRGEIRSISSGRIIEGKRGKGKGVMEDGGGEILLDSAIWPEGKRKDFSTIECARKGKEGGMRHWGRGRGMILLPFSGE